MIKNIDSEYFDLKHALFALNDFEDGVYHIRGELTWKGRLHHLIGLKIKDKLHIFDYAKDYSFKWFKSCECHINKNASKTFKYVVEFGATRVEDMDLKAIFLGKVSNEFTDVLT